MAAWHSRADAGRAGEARRSALRRGPFRWHRAKKARGYDLRVARRPALSNWHADDPRARARRRHRARAGALVLEGARHRQAQLALVEHRADHVAARGDVYPPSRPSALRVTAVAETASRDVRRIQDDRGVVRYELWAAARCSRAAPRRRSPRRAFRAPPSMRCASAPSTRPATSPALPSRTRARVRAPTPSPRTRPGTCVPSRSPTRASR